MFERIDSIVIGAGVIGLAIARACARAGHETIVLESESVIGSGISSRNSEVVHAGIYYLPGSLKARLCVSGRDALYRYCDIHTVPYRRCGKLIVATNEAQLESLAAIAANARANGVDNLRWLPAAEARVREPDLRCTAALESPSTGIVDSHSFMLSLIGEIERRGGAIIRRSPVVGGDTVSEGIALQVEGDEPTEVVARHVVNAAGLKAQQVARSIRGVRTDTIPSLYFAKGNYYALSGRSPFSRLIYPIPEPGGLGVHLTLDTEGRARFGPDVEWLDEPSYDVDPNRAANFYGAIRKYWPDLASGALRPDYAGVRPKLVHAGEPAADFAIHGPEAHDVPGLIQLYGIESPGLTSSLAIADEVVARLYE